MLRKLKQLSKYRRRNLWALLYGSKWVAAGAIIFRADGKLLLIKHRYRGSWEYPMGMTDGAESPLETARRELFEEVGLQPENLQLVGVDFFHRRTPNGNLAITFTASVEWAEARQLNLDPYEATDFCWVSRAEALELVEPWLRRRLEEYLAAYDADRPVYLHRGLPVVR